MCKSRACNNGPLTWKPKVKKNGNRKKSPNGMPMFSQCHLFLDCAFFFFVFFFVFQLIGWATQVVILWLAWYCWLGGVCLDVVVSGSSNRKRSTECGCSVGAGPNGIRFGCDGTCTSAPVYFVSAPSKT